MTVGSSATRQPFGNNKTTGGSHSRQSLFPCDVQGGLVPRGGQGASRGRKGLGWAWSCPQWQGSREAWSDLGPPPSPQAEGNKRRFEHSVWKWRQKMEAWQSTRVTSLSDGIRQPVIPGWPLRQEAGRGSSLHCSLLVASRRG